MTRLNLKIAVSLAAVLAYATIAILPLSSTRTDVARQGVRAWRQGEFEIAASHFGVDESTGDWATRQYNRGTALASAALKSQSPDQLLQAVGTLGQTAYQGDASLRAAALYNAGSAQLLVGKADNAIPLLRGAILADPDLLDAKINLSLALRKVAEERESKAQTGHSGSENDVASAEQDASANSGSGPDPSSGPNSEGGKQGGESGVGRGNETSLADSGQGDTTSPSEESGTESNIGQSPRTLSSKEMGLEQKLDALERRSSQLRRAGLLKKSSDRKERMRGEPDGR